MKSKVKASPLPTPAKRWTDKEFQQAYVDGKHHGEEIGRASALKDVEKIIDNFKIGLYIADNGDIMASALKKGLKQAIKELK